MDRASQRSRDGRRKPGVSPTQCSPTWSLTKAEWLEVGVVLVQLPRHPKTAGVTVAMEAVPREVLSVPVHG